MDREKLIELTGAIAKVLGWDYKSNKECWTQTITKDGKGLHVRTDGRERLIISGVWPRFTDSAGCAQIALPHYVKEECRDITVAAARSPEAIAKDIERRFLPEYNRVWEKLVKHCEEVTTHYEEKRRNWEKVCKRIGADPNKHTVSIDVQGGWAYIYAESAKSVRLDLRGIPVDLALKVIDLVEAK